MPDLFVRKDKNTEKWISTMGEHFVFITTKKLEDIPDQPTVASGEKDRGVRWQIGITDRQNCPSTRIPFRIHFYSGKNISGRVRLIFF